jgi:hypothetical protein
VQPFKHNFPIIVEEPAGRAQMKVGNLNELQFILRISAICVRDCVMARRVII